MDNLRVLIADGTEEFRCDLAALLRSDYQIRTSGEGMETLELLRTFAPDILVVDLMLPGLDGISLLREALNIGPRPAILATTQFVSRYVLEVVQRLGVGYLMVKPCDINAVAMRIVDLAEQLKMPRFHHLDPRTVVTNQLLTLGVSTKLRGYGCLREAVLLMADDPAQSITKELYPAVAARCGGSGQQVERSIRNAISTAWENRDERIWRLFFTAEADGHVPRPTNAAFISRLADSLNLEEDAEARREYDILLAGEANRSPWREGTIIGD